MKGFNEGKACEAILRHIEQREGSVRRDLRFPEQEHHPAPVELTCLIGNRLFALEHTGIEPFEGQVEIEAKSQFDQLRAIFATHTSTDEYYELEIPSGATLGLSRKQIEKVTLALHQWIDQIGQTLDLIQLGLRGTPTVRNADAAVPFDVKLYRKSFPNPKCGLSVVHQVNNPDDLRLARIRRACAKKFPKLADWKSDGARTVLVLEAIDDQLTNAVDVAKAVLEIEKQLGDKPDEIYLVVSAFPPWWVWYVRVDSRSYFDLTDPNERAWDIDPGLLSPVTPR